MTLNRTIQLGEVEAMTEKSYLVKVPELARNVTWTNRDGQTVTGLGAMDLVREIGIATKTAYKAVDPDQAQKISLDSCNKIYVGLKAMRATVNGRPIQQSDVWVNRAT